VATSVEARGTSVEEAIASGLSELGQAREEVDVEVIDEGRRGLLGRKAHVRLTVLTVTATAPEEAETPTASQEAAPEEAPDVAPHHPTIDDPEDHQEDPVSDTEAPQDQSTDKPEEELTDEEFMELLDRDADLAADFIEGLLDLLDLPGDIEIVTEEQQALVTVQDVGSGLLIGRRGATLDALQELVRCAIQRQTERRTHVRVDVEGYRARQLEKLRDKCREAIAEVRETGEPARLEPMDAYERKMMHDLVAKTGGVSSSSEGNEPRRRVVVHPAD
jgi:spoIIIJ-associated protein